MYDGVAVEVTTQIIFNPETLLKRLSDPTLPRWKVLEIVREATDIVHCKYIVPEHHLEHGRERLRRELAHQLGTRAVERGPVVTRELPWMMSYFMEPGRIFDTWIEGEEGCTKGN